MILASNKASDTHTPIAQLDLKIDERNQILELDKDRLEELIEAAKQALEASKNLQTRSSAVSQ